MTPTTDPLVGTTIAHYDILAKLGGGGMGVVYAARDTRLGRRVALKLLPPQWGHDEGAKQRFLREAQAASATDHRNICTIHDIDTAPDGRLFIVMALYEGPTLKQRLDEGALTPDEAMEIAAQIAEGLARAHAEGIVHRDLKPGNLILTDDGVRILDFGLARFVGSQHLTLDGSTLGTVAYMSPEQSRGEDADARSDVWAVGVVLYQMLAGELPFKGAYTEAIAHAVRTQPAPSLDARAGEHRGPLERVIQRALEKDPQLRYQSARDLARDLRLIQGRTLPLDLRSGPVPAPSGAQARRRRWRAGRAAAAAAVAVVAVLVGVPAWLLTPAAPVPILVAPVINATGDAELDRYRMALTRELIAELESSPYVRAIPYERVLGVVRRFREANGDPSSRDALQALAAASDARTIVVPTLVYEDGGWRGHLEFRSAATATSDGAFDSEPVVSSLAKDTAYRLMPPLAAAVEAHVLAAGSRRVALGAQLRRLTGAGPAAAANVLPNLDAAAAFETGLDGYERLEYSIAREGFAAASAASPRDPLLLAWRSRVARLMRLDPEAAEFAAQASALPLGTPPEWQRLFVEAVSADGIRNVTLAHDRYNALSARFPADARWLTELAAFRDREELNTEAITAYQAALALDDRLTRPRLELCRLYNRVSESVAAKEQAQRALQAFQAAGNAWLEAQALFCLSDALRTGARGERDEARAAADQALQILESLGAGYQVGRAYYYVALIAGAQGRLEESLRLNGRALELLEQHGNLPPQPLVLGNMGVASNRLGLPAQAVEYYRSAARLHESLGDDRRAAQNQANAAAVVIQYGGDRARGLREVENALQVSRKVGDRLLEVLCLQLIGAFYRDAGNYAEAERADRQGLAIARERNLADRVTTLTTDLAAARVDAGDLSGAKQILEEAIGSATAVDAGRLRIRLAHVKVLLRDIEGATTDLDAAAAAIPAANAAAVAPLTRLVRGKLEFETGRFDAARPHFAAAATPPPNQPPDASAIEARAYLALLDARSGRQAQARAQARDAIAQAEALGRQSLQQNVVRIASEIR